MGNSGFSVFVDRATCPRCRMRRRFLVVRVDNVTGEQTVELSDGPVPGRAPAEFAPHRCDESAPAAAAGRRRDQVRSHLRDGGDGR